MTLKQYQTLCIKTEPPYLSRGDEAMLGLLGLSASSGECLRLYKKTLYEGAELDQKGIVRALGWAICDISRLAHAIDTDLETILRASADELESMLKDNSHAGDEEKE
jgi:hypothetical protein